VLFRLREDIIYSEFIAMACLTSNMIDAGSTFATTLELSRLFVAPILNLFDATWIRFLILTLVTHVDVQRTWTKIYNARAKLLFFS